MNPATMARNFAVVTALIAAAILYGSLFPFHFREPAGDVGPLGALLQTWNVLPTSRGDPLSNILLYLPFGFFGMLAVRNRLGAPVRVVVVTLAGLVLCVAVELVQVYDVGRVTSLTDVYSNTLGTMLGAAGGLIVGADFRWPFLREISTRPVPALLLVAWLGYRLFPYVPTIDLHKYWDAMKPVVLTPSLPPYDLFRYTVTWLTIASLVEAVARQDRSRLLFPLLAAFVIGAKIVILTKVLSVAEIAGAGLAFVVWLLLLRAGARGRSVLLAALLGALVVAQRLEPFQFQAAAGHFTWIPFLSLMRGSISVDSQSFLEKFFLYGGLVWLLVEAGLRLRIAAVLVALVLFVTSQAEMYLPGRSAEITDALMTLLIAGAFALIAPTRKRDASGAAGP